MALLFAWMLPLGTEDAATEGKKVITSMLVVGLVFVAVIALCAYLQAENIAGDGAVWAATSACLGRGALDDARSSLRLDNDPGPLERRARELAGDAAVNAALSAHRERLR